MPLDKAFDSITEADLQSLVADGVVEGKTIEYKAALPDSTYDSMKDLLADVSSFANAAGGHLVFGMVEEGGMPVDVCGLHGVDADAQLLRIENIVRDGIQPRIPGLLMRGVPLSGEAVAIVIRIPSSWAQPHVVQYRRHWRFYSRNSTGKYPLDVSEVRAACVLSESIAERMALFRSERLGRIVAGQTPVPVGDDAKMVLHILPFGAFHLGARLDIASLGSAIRTLDPIGAHVSGHSYNLDGLVTYAHGTDPHGPPYVQVFRSGAIEAVETRMLPFKFADDDPPRIPSVTYETQLLARLPTYLSLQERLGLAPPLVIMLSLIGVSGYVMGVTTQLGHSREHEYPIDRDVLLLPEVMVDTFAVEPAEVMQPIFDSVWNAAGWARSMNYDESGNWGKGPNYPA